MKREQGLPAFGGARGDRGFTLIELMITIIILSVLLGLAIPGFSRWLPNYRLRGAARDLYSNLQLAKSGTIKDRANWAVEFPGGNIYRLVSGGVVHKTVSLPDYGSGVSFGPGSSTPPAVANAVTADSANPIVFNSRGFTTNNAPVFAYMTNNRNTSYAVGTLVSGAVVLKKWNGTAWQ